MTTKAWERAKDLAEISRANYNNGLAAGYEAAQNDYAPLLAAAQHALNWAEGNGMATGEMPEYAEELHEALETLEAKAAKVTK